MAKVEEKAKVGRPKLADEETRKDSWISIAACLVVALVMVLSGSCVLAGTSVREYMSLRKSNLKAQAILKEELPKRVTVIPAKKTITKTIKPNGEVTYVIPPSN